MPTCRRRPPHKVLVRLSRGWCDCQAPLPEGPWPTTSGCLSGRVGPQIESDGLDVLLTATHLESEPPRQLQHGIVVRHHTAPELARAAIAAIADELAHEKL